jgi:hypothetical protein
VPVDSSLFQIPQTGNRVSRRADGLEQNLALRFEARKHIADAVDHHPLRRIVDFVDDVVEFLRQRVDVLPVDRSEIRLLQAVKRFVRELVADVLAPTSSSRRSPVASVNSTSNSAARSAFWAPLLKQSKNSRFLGNNPNMSPYLLSAGPHALCSVMPQRIERLKGNALYGNRAGISIKAIALPANAAK